jgi:hypothetical protein
MKWGCFFAAGLALAACGKSPPNAQVIASAEAKSTLGPITKWKLDAAVNGMALQQMRDRAYVFCLARKASDKSCAGEQDWSLFTYANAFSLFREFRSEANPTSPFAKAYQQRPSAFELPRRYCLSVYVDSGSQDARSLGPCMSVAIGRDYFGVVAIP